MGWQGFLQVLCDRREYGLTSFETAVVMCLEENECPSKQELLQRYIKLYSSIEEEAFTQRLKNIYNKFKIVDSGHKLPQLYKYLSSKYIEYKNKDVFFAGIGLNNIYPNFPRDIFAEQIDRIICSEKQEDKKLDILQTFAPNLDQYYEKLIECIRCGVSVRILLAWPYSEAARLRESVLRKYAEDSVTDDFNIRESVIANLEILEKIIKIFGDTDLLTIKLYDTLPSLAIYRAGNYMLAGLFLHGSLAVNTFQLELNLSASNQLIVNTLQKDFELLWKVSRKFYPDPQKNWRNDLTTLFRDKHND